MTSIESFLSFGSRKRDPPHRSTTIWTERLPHSLSKRSEQISLLAKNFVLFTQNDDFWLMRSNFCRIEQSKTQNRQYISRFPEMRDGSIQGDRPVATNTVNYVGLKSLAVRDVADQDALVFFELD